MNPIKKLLCERITDLTEDLSRSKHELEFLEGFDVGRKSWRYAALYVHVEWMDLKIEIFKALGGV